MVWASINKSGMSAARARARRADRHRKATGTLPRRVRVLSRPVVRPLAGPAADFASRARAGGPAFPDANADREDLSFVPVAFERLPDKLVKSKTAVPAPDPRLRTASSRGTPTPHERARLKDLRKAQADKLMADAESHRPASRSVTTKSPEEATIIEDDDEDLPLSARRTSLTITTGETQLQIIGELEDDG